MKSLLHFPPYYNGPKSLSQDSSEAADFWIGLAQGALPVVLAALLVFILQ